MDQSKRLAKVAISCLVALSVAMTAANVWLLKVNHVLRASRTVTLPQVDVGKRVAAIGGVGYDGREIDLRTGSGKSTLLLVYSPTCHYCERNWPAWTSVLRELNSAKVQAVAIDLSAKSTEEFIAHKQTGQAVLVQRLDPQQLLDLNLNVTPQTILIGGDAKVKKVWTGVMSSADLQSLRNQVL